MARPSSSTGRPSAGVGRRRVVRHASRIAEHSFTPGPVWIGIDLSSGDDRCVEHDGNGYVVDTNHAPGNFADFPPSESTSGGACE